MSRPARGLAQLSLAMPQRALELSFQELAHRLDGASEATVRTREQIAREGQWLMHPAGPFQLTAETFASMEANQRKFDEPFVDKEHQSNGWGDDSDSQGWVKALDIGSDPKDPSKKALYATIEWNPDAVAAIRGKKFRYLSMGVDLAAKDLESGEPIGAWLHHVALVKRAFIQQMRPLTASIFPGPGRAEGDTDMNQVIEKLRTLLKAGADANEAAILVKLQGVEGGVEVLLSGGAAVPRAILVELGLDPAKVGPAELLQLAAKIKGADELAASNVRLAMEKIDVEIQSAVDLFKITPAEKASFLKLARAGGETLDEVRRIIAARKPAPPAKGAPNTPANTVAATRLARQLAAIDKAKKDHNITDDMRAFALASKEDPELFSSDESEE